MVLLCSYDSRYADDFPAVVPVECCMLLANTATLPGLLFSPSESEHMFDLFSDKYL